MTYGDDKNVNDIQLTRRVPKRNNSTKAINYNNTYYNTGTVYLIRPALQRERRNAQAAEYY